MKSVTFMLRMFAAFLPVLFFTSCDDENCERGRGDVVIRELNLSDVSGLRVNGDTRVFVRRGAAQRIEIKGQPNVLDAIRTDVDNGVWDISFDRCLRSHKTVEVHMTVQEMTSTELVGSGRVELQDAFEVDEFRAVLEGSGSLSANVVAAKVTSRLSGSGSIGLSGAATVQEASLTGSGKIRAFDLTTESTGVVLSGSGDVEVHAASNLSVNISGSGNVYYRGDPGINSTISGSGRVIKR